MTLSRETEVGEVSFVPLGADQQTHVSIAAAAGGVPGCDLATVLRQAAQDEMNRVRAMFGRPPLGVAAAPVPRTTDPLPTMLRGVALRFGVLNQAAVSRHDGTRGIGYSVIFRGALDGAIGRLRAGRDRIALCIRHDPGSELCNTDNSGLRWRLILDGSRVLIKIPVDTPAAKLATHVIQANGLFGLSLALQPVEQCECPGLADHVGVRRAEIVELTATARPADRECRLRAV